MPPAGTDSVAVEFSGTVKYVNSGTGAGGFNVTRDVFGVRTVKGSMALPGTTGGLAKVTVVLERAWVLPVWSGEVRVNDPGARLSRTTPFVGQVAEDAATGRVSGRQSWFVALPFPQLLRPYTLEWSVLDAG